MAATEPHCARSPPCAHAGPMARRLALLLLLVLAGATAHVPRRHSTRTYTLHSSSSDSESLDPFVMFDDYSDSREPPPPTPSKISAKVILRTKGPIVNTTVKTPKSENKKILPAVIKTANSSKLKKVQVVAERPLKNSSWAQWRDRPLVEVSPQFVLMSADSASPDMELLTTSRPPTTRQPPSKTTSRPPKSTKKPPRSTRKPPKSTKKPQKYTKNTTCPPKNTGWFSSFFQDNKLKRVEKKPTKPAWYSGLFTTLYTWIWGSKDTQSSSWFTGGSWFSEERGSTTSTTTTTAAPVTTTSVSWFESLLDSEEDDGAYVTNNTKKTPKKAAKKSYKGYQLLRAYPEVQWKVHEMLDLKEEAQDSGLEWWTSPSINGSTDLLVPPDLLADIKDHLKSLKIDFDVVIWDLQKAIMYENPKLSKKQRLELEQLRGHPLTWRRYHRYADILRYLEYLQHSYGDLIELIPLGRSSEGLPLVVVKIALPKNDTLVRESNQNGHKKKWKLRSLLKPAVWIEGGTHAREWIAPAVATWILHTIVEGEKGLGSEHEMLRQADFYIMPVLNPDGYEHSHTHDRLWRKTRSRHSEQTDDYFSTWFPWNWGRTDCVGVDADRNWDYHWGEQDASKDPCADNYAGPHPFSEPETRAVSAFLAEHRDQIKVYMSLHAYSQAWLIPSSHAHAPFADDGVLMEMGKLATAALADLYGTKYQVGTAADLRQPASGMSHDWAKARAGVKFSYHVDLRDSYGPYGFLLPGSQIVSTARETWQAVKAIVDNLHP